MEEKVICQNRASYHDYYILEKYEAGIVLDGGEVKSLKNGKGNLKDSFCFLENGELVIKNMHISVYDKSAFFNEKNAKRDRKLLLHKEEILKLKTKINQKGLTLIPLKIYLKKALIKVELGLCQGKHTFDKKKVTMEKDIIREQERQIKQKI